MAKKQFITFKIGDNLFGIDVLQIREINSDMNFTKVDRAPEFVAGLLNLRGQIVTIVDIGVKLGLGRRPVTSMTRCVVLKVNSDIQRIRRNVAEVDDTSEDIVGFLIDKLEDMVEISDQALERAPANMEVVNAEYVKGVVKTAESIMIALKSDVVFSIDRKAR